ncbi:MAG: 2'-5' RNA ligase family protein [Halococcoides sp.]
MFSLNVPVPAAVHERADAVASECPPGTVRPRAERTLVVKRLGEPDAADRLSARAREVIRGQPPIAARIDGLVVFEEPPAGPAPVLALAIDSPGLERLHDRLCAVFDPIEGIEAGAYRPHVTVARGAGVVREIDFETHRWSIDALALYDASRHLPAGRIDLPA